mmetsp:Transcript_27572/g.36163  ORF Transcript_27572/g.36163 Transcript_27572/m.36163 type:complete len:301 (+) Transcript_27572:202-1104(+)
MANTTVKNIPNEIEEIVSENKLFLEIHFNEDNNKFKVHCNVTGHDLPLQVDQIKKHMTSKKFLKQRDWYSYDYREYEPYIKPHRFDSRKLYCIVTQRTLNKIPKEVKAHFEGRKFRLRRQEWEARKKEREAEKEKRKQQQEEGADFWMPGSDEEEDSKTVAYKAQRPREANSGIASESGGEEDEEAEESEEEDLKEFLGDEEDYAPVGDALPDWSTGTTRAKKKKEKRKRTNDNNSQYMKLDSVANKAKKHQNNKNQEQTSPQQVQKAPQPVTKKVKTEQKGPQQNMKNRKKKKKKHKKK